MTPEWHLERSWMRWSAARAGGFLAGERRRRRRCPRPDRSDPGGVQPPPGPAPERTPQQPRRKEPRDASRAYRLTPACPAGALHALPGLLPGHAPCRRRRHPGRLLLPMRRLPAGRRAAGEPPPGRGDAPAGRRPSRGVGRPAWPGARPAPARLCPPAGGWPRWVSGRLAGCAARRGWTRLRRVLLRWQAPQPPCRGCVAWGSWTPLASPPATPLASPPPRVAGPTPPRVPGLLLVMSPSWGQSAAKTAADWPPSGERSGR